jgi:hypothetical protein
MFLHSWTSQVHAIYYYYYYYYYYVIVVIIIIIIIIYYSNKGTVALGWLSMAKTRSTV